MSFSQKAAKCISKPASGSRAAIPRDQCFSLGDDRGSMYRVV